MPGIHQNLQEILPIIFVIFIGIFLLIMVARVVFLFILNQAYKRYLALKKTSKKIFTSSKKNFPKEDEELLRKKHQFPRAHSAVKAELQEQQKSRTNQSVSGSYELMPSQQQELDREEMGKVEIVDIVKPIGFWTSMILGQKLTYLIQSANTINQRGKKGFWVSMIEAKDRAAGRQQGRGR